LGIERKAGNTTTQASFAFPLNELNGEGALWRAGWDRLQQPPDLILSGTIGWRAFKLLRALQVDADVGLTMQWLRAFEEGSAGWGDLEKIAPQLRTVPLLVKWRASQLAAGKSVNRRARPKGNGRRSVQFELDCVAIGTRESAGQCGRVMSWADAARIAWDRYPKLRSGTFDDMVNRLQKRQKPQKKWREMQAGAGMPPSAK
jgi:hypothetical protein